MSLSFVRRSTVAVFTVGSLAISPLAVLAESPRCNEIATRATAEVFQDELQVAIDTHRFLVRADAKDRVREIEREVLAKRVAVQTAWNAVQRQMTALQDLTPERRQAKAEVLRDASRVTKNALRSIDAHRKTALASIDSALKYRNDSVSRAQKDRTASFQAKLNAWRQASCASGKISTYQDIALYGDGVWYAVNENDTPFDDDTQQKLEVARKNFISYTQGKIDVMKSKLNGVITSLNQDISEAVNGLN